MTVAEDAHKVLDLIADDGPQDCDQICTAFGWPWTRYIRAMQRLRYHDLAHCDHDNGRRWTLGAPKVASPARPAPEVGFDGGTNRGQYTDKDGNPLDADELARRLGR